MIYNILFAVCGIGLIALDLSLFKLGDRVDVWSSVMRNHEKLLTDQEAFTANLEEILNKYTEEDKE